MVAQLVLDGALMDAVGGELAEVGGSESTCHVHSHIHFVVNGIDGSYAARDAIEAPLETVKPVFEREASEVTVVETQATAQRPWPGFVGGRGKDTDVEEPIGRDEIFVAFVERPLPHAAQAGGDVQMVVDGQFVSHIVVEGVEHEIEARNVTTLLIFLPSVLLVGDDGL